MRRIGNDVSSAGETLADLNLLLPHHVAITQPIDESLTAHTSYLGNYGNSISFWLVIVVP